MIKARFDSPQQELTMFQEGDYIRYMVCENQTEYTETDIEGNKSKGIKCDFNEFRELKSVLSPDKVESAPADYIDYVPVNALPEKTAGKETTLEQRITDLEDAMADMFGGDEE